MKLRSLLIAALLPSLISLAAHAHAGHDHAAEAPPPPPMDDSRRAYAHSDHLELVARWPATTSSEPVPLLVFLSDFATNAPVEGATIDLSFSGAGEVEASATPTSTPGIYEATLTFPADGEYSAVATVTTGDDVDLLVVDHVTMGEDSHDAAEEHPSSGARSGSWWYLIAGIFIGSVGLAFGFRRRNIPAGVAAGVLLATGILSPLDAYAHAGHDHEPTPGAQAAGDPRAPLFLAKEAQFLLGVRTTQIQAKAVVDRVRAQGRLVAPPNRQAPLFAPQAGRLIAANASFPALGARVRKGEVLAVVDASLSAGEKASFAAETANARAAADRAAAQLDAARRKLARLESLEGIVSRHDVELGEVEVRSAEAELEGARAAARAFDGSSGTGTVRLVSPIDGVLADIGAAPGEMVDPQKRLFLVVDPRELWVEANLFEADLAAIHGAHDAVATVEAYPGEAFAGALVGTAHVVDPVTRTLKAVFRVPNPDGRLKVGMFAEVAVSAGVARKGLVISESAVSEIEGRRFVFIHNAPEAFLMREVTTGARDGASVEITSGLHAGDRVVVSGTYELRNAPRAGR